jgi:hypothetical protein
MRRPVFAIVLLLAPAIACAGILGLEAGTPRDTDAGTDGPITLPEAAPGVTYHEMKDPSRWSSFNLARLGNGSTGWLGGAFDGRYVYYAPFQGGASTEVARLDTTGDFRGDAAAWATVALDSYSTPGSPGGYQGAVFGNGRIYFVPYLKPTVYHGTVAAHLPDQLDGGIDASWKFFNVGPLAGGASVGYRGGAFDGRYLYLSPDQNGVKLHGLVARYDSQREFNDSRAWQEYDIEALVPNLHGFLGAVFDGRSLYFVPNGEGRTSATSRATTRSRSSSRARRGARSTWQP